MIVICGMGWVNKELSNLPDKKDVFPYPFENFGRLDATSKMTCYAVGLALKDAGLSYPLNQKQLIGIAATSKLGCLGADVNYFKDYLDNGRTLGRGNLFIYTLPSSPLSEAAIYFGLQGPLFYMAKPERSLAALTALAAEMICLDEASVMLVGITGEEAAVFWVLVRASNLAGGVLCDMLQAEAILNQGLSFPDIIKEFSALNQKNSGRHSLFLQDVG